jgi:2-oxoglutarate/2-oxoacid ferredoxin oxidoreductase subunit alpha
MMRALLSGNEAVAEGALAAGVSFFAGYPISPSSEIATVMARRLPALGGVFLQMEDEIASLAAVIGASLAGMKVLDATSGPGLSLKAEGIGLAIMLEVPCVIVDAQRVGPSTGMATFPSQADVMFARWGTHGDHAIIALAPSSVQECFAETVRAVNLAERFRTPVLLLTDAVIAGLHEVVELPEQVTVVDRKKPAVPPAGYRPYSAGADGVPPMAAFGTGYHWYANSSMHDEGAFEATARPDVARALIKRLHDKIYDHVAEIVVVERDLLDDAEVAVFAYGSSARAAKAAIRQARAQGVRAGLLKALTLWPFPVQAVGELAGRVRRIVVPEMNMGQLMETVRAAACGRTEVVSVPRYDGQLITPQEILDAVLAPTPVAA